MEPSHRPLPDVFCWTRFGTEAGEPIEAILGRKDRERSETDGLFLWGIGNSVAPAMLELVRQVARPEVLFSAIKSAPRQIDVAPAHTYEFRIATTMVGDRVQLPSTIHVHAGSPSEALRPRYALVCQSKTSLVLANHGELSFLSLTNLLSGSQLGASQVTAVVRRDEDVLVGGRTYVVAMRARLIEPFFIRLGDPVRLDQKLTGAPSDWPAPKQSRNSASILAGV
jgi:hypothetical protein